VCEYRRYTQGKLMFEHLIFIHEQAGDPVSPPRRISQSAIETRRRCAESEDFNKTSVQRAILATLALNTSSGRAGMVFL
jgi:hypothetical protein